MTYSAEALTTVLQSTKYVIIWSHSLPMCGTGTSTDLTVNLACGSKTCGCVSCLIGEHDVPSIYVHHKYKQLEEHERLEEQAVIALILADIQAWHSEKCVQRWKPTALQPSTCLQMLIHMLHLCNEIEWS